jgi:hypothetical protein
VETLEFMQRLETVEVLMRHGATDFEGAAPYQYNGFKIALGQDTLIRVLNDLVHPGADNAEEVAGEQA